MTSTCFLNVAVYCYRIIPYVQSDVTLTLCCILCATRLAFNQSVNQNALCSAVMSHSAGKL